jgi:hypothetical protein
MPKRVGAEISVQFGIHSLDYFIAVSFSNIDVSSLTMAVMPKRVGAN